MQAIETTSANGTTRHTDELVRQLAAVKQELAMVKSDLEGLRTKCTDMNKILHMICCPKEWYTEELDEMEIEEALARADERPTIAELIESLRDSAELSDVKPL